MEVIIVMVKVIIIVQNKIFLLLFRQMIFQAIKQAIFEVSNDKLNQNQEDVVKDFLAILEDNQEYPVSEYAKIVDLSLERTRAIAV